MEDCIYNMTTKHGLTICCLTDKPTPDFCEDICQDFAIKETATKAQLEDAAYWVSRVEKTENEPQGTWKIVHFEFKE